MFGTKEKKYVVESSIFLGVKVLAIYKNYSEEET